MVILSFQISIWGWILFFITYLIPFKFFTYYLETHNIINKFNSNTINPFSSFIIIIILISLRGIPPFAIFYIKIFLIQLITILSPIIALVILLTRVLIAYNYLSITLNLFRVGLLIPGPYSRISITFKDYLALFTIISPIILIHQ